MWLVVVDACTKWPEVLPVKSVTSSATVDILLGLIKSHGVPAQIISDNAAIFTSDEFKQFCRRFEIQQILTLPYHPRSNG